MKYRIGIIGVGMVGEQLRRWFTDGGFPVFAYDKYKNIGNADDLHRANLIFLCLPSAYNDKNKKGVDLSIFRKTIRNFKQRKIFVIKSTVPPGTTNALQESFPSHSFFHSPEFLTEATAWEDFSYPHLQLLGYTDKNKKDMAEDIIGVLPSGRGSAILPAVSTEIFKYARNAFFATKVIFANQIYDLCRSYGVDYNNLRDLMYLDPWIGGNHLHVLHKDYRGFGGKCLPKDLKTFIKAFKNKNLDPGIFGTVDKINSEMIKEQGLVDTLENYWLKNTNPKT